MKTLTNQFKKALMVIAFFALNFLAFSNLSAQTYFTPGQPYVFRSIINATQTRVITIVFDAKANATLSSQLVTIAPGDKIASYSFGPGSEMSYNGTTNTINILQNINKYIVISFTDPTQTQAAPLGGFTITCSCKKASTTNPPPPPADCTVNRQSTGGPDCYCITCVVNATCDQCKKSESGSSGTPLNTNDPNANYLLIKVNSLSYQ